MKLSTRTQYGVRALVDLAMHNTGHPVQLKDIAERQQISLSYLEHLVIPLIAAGILKSTRGAHGGITLAKSPQQIRMNIVMEILEGPLAPVDCLKDAKNCPRSAFCAPKDVWDEMKKAMENVLEATSLQDVADRQKAKTVAPSSMYYI